MNQVAVFNWLNSFSYSHLDREYLGSMFHEDPNL